MTKVINDIILPSIAFAWKSFNDIISALPGASIFLLYTIFIFLVFRFILAPVLRIHLGRIQSEIAGSDKAKPHQKKKHTQDYWQHKKQKEKYKL